MFNVTISILSDDTLKFQMKGEISFARIWCGRDPGRICGILWKQREICIWQRAPKVLAFCTMNFSFSYFSEYVLLKFRNIILLLYFTICLAIWPTLFSQMAVQQIHFSLDLHISHVFMVNTLRFIFVSDVVTLWHLLASHILTLCIWLPKIEFNY